LKGVSVLSGWFSLHAEMLTGVGIVEPPMHGVVTACVQRECHDLRARYDKQVTGMILEKHSTLAIEFPDISIALFCI
jgi:hypothetical protein